MQWAPMHEVAAGEAGECERLEICLLGGGVQDHVGDESDEYLDAHGILADAGVVPGRLAVQPHFDLAQTGRARELCQQKGQELILGRQLANPVVRTMLFDKSVEEPLRDMLCNAWKTLL